MSLMESFVLIRLESDSVSGIGITISCVPSKVNPLMLRGVANFVAEEAFPVNFPTILGAIKETLSPMSFTPPADICRFPATFERMAAGTFWPKVSLAIDKEPDEIKRPLNGFSIVPRVDVEPKASIFPATVTFFEEEILPFISISKASSPDNCPKVT